MLEHLARVCRSLMITYQGTKAATRLRCEVSVRIDNLTQQASALYVDEGLCTFPPSLRDREDNSPSRNTHPQHCPSFSRCRMLQSGPNRFSYQLCWHMRVLDGKHGEREEG